MPIKKFPNDFVWGAAYSSHQVEGNNKNNDWWDWEQQGKTKEKSGWACDSWNRYPIDHQLVQDLGCGGFRFSLEWSRIEPEEGVFSSEAIDHYRKVLKDLKKRKIRTFVTLWHWSLPLWFAKKYGWHHKDSTKIFTRYCEKVIEQLGEEIDFLITLNEPRLHLNKGYITKEFPPGKRNPFFFLKARRNMVKAHIGCYETTKKINKNVNVGLTQYTNAFKYQGKAKLLKKLTESIENFYNWYFFLQIGKAMDYVGVNFYYGYDYEIKPWLPFVKRINHPDLKSDLGWEFTPRGIHDVTMSAWQKFKLPIYIFENGAADSEDKIRARYIKEHLRWLHRSIRNGADIKGYFYWSLIDNFEWAEGFWPRFGLCEMDYQTMERKPRKSYYFYQEIIKKNAIED
jgi:beta-glucosidase